MMFKRLIKKLFRCPQYRSLIFVWRVKVAEYALGQVETKTTISIGSLVILSWTTIYTPQSDWEK